jgi:hypothetical protein
VTGTSDGRGHRWWARRFLIVAVVGLQVAAAFGFYGGPHRVLGWRMFNASSDWQAEVFRVTADGERYPIEEPWPGGYGWGELVSARGLGAPHLGQHAPAGLVSTLDYLQHALDWVAANTPADQETLRLEVRVTFWENGRGRERTFFVSVDRSLPGRWSRSGGLL